MNCSEIQEVWSSYYDDQLATNQRALVEEHLDTCPECSQSLAEFRSLSDMARNLPDPKPPDGLWSAIERGLDERHLSKPNHGRTPLLSRNTFVVVVAVAVVLVSVGMWLNFVRNDGRSQMDVDMATFLDNFSSDPAASQQILLANYDHKAVNLEQAAEQLNYRPVATQQLPNGYSLEKVYMIEMPCCTCVQCIYEGENNEMLTVFEHTADQPMWFGKRPEITCPCKGRETKIISFNGQLAASWSTGNRHLTVVGARDMEQVVTLIDHFDKSVLAQGAAE